MEGCASPSSRCGGQTHRTAPASGLLGGRQCAVSTAREEAGRPGVREDWQRRKHLKEDLPLQNVPFPSCPVCSPVVPSAGTTPGDQYLPWPDSSSCPHILEAGLSKEPFTYFSLSAASVSSGTCTHTRWLWPGDSSSPWGEGAGGGPTPGCWGEGRCSKCLHRCLVHQRADWQVAGGRGRRY